MLREMCRAKLHRAVVTETKLDYHGSITIDGELMEAAGILPGEKVQVVNINNGHRSETYAIAGEHGDRAVCLNGAAARWAEVGDRIIVMTYALLSEEELAGFKTRVIVLDDNNRIIEKL